MQAVNQKPIAPPSQILDPESAAFRAGAAPLEKRILRLRTEVAALAKGGERAYASAKPGAPRTFRWQMNALNMEREELEKELDANFPDPLRHVRNAQWSMCAELKREAGIQRDHRARAMQKYARAVRPHATQEAAACRTPTLAKFLLKHANELPPHPASTFWTSQPINRLEGFAALRGPDQARLGEFAVLAREFRAADSHCRIALRLLLDPELSAISLEEFNRNYSAASQQARIEFATFLHRHFPDRPADPSALVEDISELYCRADLPPLAEEFFLLPRQVRDSHYATLVALAGKIFKRIEDLILLEMEAGPSPSPAEKRAIASGNLDLKALSDALSAHAPEILQADDFNAALLLLEPRRGNLPRLEDET